MKKKVKINQDNLMLRKTIVLLGIIGLIFWRVFGIQFRGTSKWYIITGIILLAIIFLVHYFNKNHAKPKKRKK